MGYRNDKQKDSIALSMLPPGPTGGGLPERASWGASWHMLIEAH